MKIDAAPELYRQAKLWDTRPDPDDTAFDTFRRVIGDDAVENGESSLYDRRMLLRLARLSQVFAGHIEAIRLTGSSSPTGTIPSASVTPKVAETAARLSAATPASRQVRIVGELDMIRHSTRGFSLRLASVEEINGVMESIGGLAALPDFFGKNVLVQGRAVYRPSGRLLRIDAAAIEDGAGASSVFAKVPLPKSVRPPISGRLKLSETGRRGVPAFFGVWPGDETAAEIEALVKDVRGCQARVN